MKKYLLIIPVIIFMVGITYFSSQDVVQSTDFSTSVSIRIYSMIDPGFKDLPEAEQMTKAYAVDENMRHVGHCTEYFLLRMVVYIALRKKRRSFLWTFAICACFAAGDEIHQYFVPGRACQLSDWVIDMIGVMVLLGIAWAVRRRREKLDELFDVK
ncbi:VanZ family protein [Aminicella lysinilytica]|uniref:VanZ family protein n=1 Tax=Aminicella lysinilytica TaxID=433323 RepID=A0A4R6PXE7_9FIRM|nr:VanZ family protein [Aminicella lysinilytica]TDP50349.1 VanZ family protein [Aminicella lysinilytica]